MAESETRPRVPHFRTRHHQLTCWKWIPRNTFVHQTQISSINSVSLSVAIIVLIMDAALEHSIIWHLDLSDRLEEDKRVAF